MRVLYVLDNLAIASGVSAIVLNLYRNMDLKRIHMDFLVCNYQEESFEKEILQHGGKVYYTGNFLSPNQIISAILKSKQFFEEHANEYDIIHLHSPTIAMFTLKYAKQYGIPVRIVHSHSTMMSVNRLKNFINGYLISQIKKYATNYFACSTEAAYFLYGKEFCDTHKIELIHNAVDCRKFLYNQEMAKLTRQKLGISDEKVFVHVSNYSPIKNHIFLIDVIKRFKNTHKKVRFVFVGDGPMRRSFESEITNSELQELCIFIDKTNDVAQYFFAADAAILPSLKEGLPVTLIEAQATGLPFFTTDTVTHEVLVGQGEFIHLNADNWFDRLNEFMPLTVQERQEHSNVFQKSAFNIAMESKRVVDVYEKLARHECSTKN